VVVDGNLFENNWEAAQGGPAILFTPRNQEGSAPWVAVRDVRFVNNRVRHVAAVFNILGHDDVSPSQLTRNILIENNVFEDVSSQNWGGTGRLLLITGGEDIRIRHNTIFQDGSTFVYAYGDPTAGFEFTANIVPHGDYGILGDSASPGLGTLGQYFPDAEVTANLIVTCQANYPAGNFYPATLASVGFVDLAAGDYRLSAGSPFKSACSDGTDPGADMSRIR
jgi:hypothetical protein